jgi:phosphatidylglycerophosphate synthase
MRKIDSIYENPIDNVLIDIAEYFNPFLKKIGMTPNMVTFGSLLFGLGAIYALYYDHLVWFAILYFISYFLDIQDGSLARTYNMTSKFGDLFDHLKDVFVVVALLYVFWKKNYNCASNLKIILIILAIMFVLMNCTLGCQERIYNKDESPTLSYQKELCFGDPKETIKYTRFFGCGSFVIVLILCIIYIEKTKVCK